MKKRLSALSMKRRKPSVTVPISRIKVRDDFQPDEIFTSLYIRFLNGKTTITSTRMSLSNIREGFYKPRPGSSFEYICDEPPTEFIDSLVGDIRRGHRPAIYVYKNISPDDDRRFVCPDDVCTYRAYKHLGIAKVPVLVLSQGIDHLEESGIRLRSFTSKGKSERTYMESTAPINTGEVPSYLGLEPLPNYISAIDSLISRVADVRRRLKKFHDPSETEFHYHHTLHSYLYRLDEALRATKLLIAEDLWFQIAPILRSTYEASLNFYLDWLAPDRMHMFFAMSASLKSNDLKRVIDAIGAKEDESDSISIAAQKSMQRMFSLVTNVKQKAEMSPFGTEFHERIYSFLSGVAHQNFNIVAEYANLFLEELAHPHFSTIDQAFMIRSFDIITALICVRVGDDIAASS